MICTLHLFYIRVKRIGEQIVQRPCIVNSCSLINCFWMWSILMLLNFHTRITWTRGFRFSLSYTRDNIESLRPLIICIVYNNCWNKPFHGKKNLEINDTKGLQKTLKDYKKKMLNNRWTRERFYTEKKITLFRVNHLKNTRAAIFWII